MQSLWLTLLAAHAAAASVWWWMMPHGFPSSSTSYWANEFAPWVVVCLVALGIVARGALSLAVLPPLLLAMPLLWMSMALSSRLTFPESIGFSWNLLFGAGFVFAVLWARQFKFRFANWFVAVPIFLLALYTGWWFPGTQRSAEPSTSPANVALTPLASPSTDARMIKLGKDVHIQPDNARVVIRRDKLVLSIDPFLTIKSRSPDRSWTNLANPDDNKRTARRFVGSTKEPNRVHLQYKDEGDSVLDVTGRDGAVELEARSKITQPIYTHLNQYAGVVIHGHKKLTFSLSAIPNRRFEIPRPSAPRRFAYVDREQRLCLMDADKGEKGPFHEIASGALKRGEPLVLTLYDGETAAFRISLDDWSAQASTELSPSAGWSVPMNAIELFRGGDADDSPAQVSFSLASTSIGRGYQSVGYAIGTYRNRMTITK